MNKNLLEAFNIKEKTNYIETNDYMAFKDKKLVDSFRIRILEDLSDKGFGQEIISGELINQEINDITYGYDLSNNERNYLFNLIDGEVNGYGPITELLKDDNITEIMVNSASEIYIEIDGVLEKDDSISFINDAHIIRTIERLISPTGKTIDINSPMVDARLENGSRINAIIPPLSKHPVITIRKFKKNVVDMDTLVGNGSLTPYMARFLEAVVKSRLNVLISGAAGAGKTTVLNILSNFIPEKERIINIEDVREITLSQENIISLETKISNYDGIGEITTRELLKNSLRMRPDRIIIGEIRGGEAYDFLQAINTGHEGSLTTIHANSPKDALNRLETMIFMDGLDIPIDIVVHISRMSDGKRKITNIIEVQGVNKNGELDLQDIFEFKNEGTNKNGTIKGEYILYEKKPQCLTKIVNAGFTDIKDMFKTKKSK